MEELLNQQQSRINFYALISRLLMFEIDEMLLETIENDPNMMEFFPSYVKWEKRQELSRADLIERYLNVDFTNLFLLHMIPYESFYRREDQQMETGGENPVVQLFAEQDFHVDLTEARAVSVDHIGIELEYMYMLCDAERKAIEDDSFEAVCELAKMQKKFLQEHLLEWAPMFLINIKGEANTAFYFDVADIALEFMMSDFQYLNDLIQDEKCNYQV